ncbi:hypothetical protein SAMN05443665_10687 [Actinomadura meyerae]|uniref:Uncharacterized protein n=1 Tax=Actinomadura meyerae TaxID=240840 RepID=A0A239P4H5_9ACTN|nr:hypothetical protein [Actinomadura meyerae]SNT62031.1 hypothetical protein SAMN05443665_10687 [Actinomadura meyerae]
MRSIVYGIVGIVLGIGLFIGGIASSGGGEVKCGSRTMSPGDTCTTIRNGSSTERTYDEQKAQNGRENVIMMIIGPIVAIGGVVFLAGAGRGRRRVRHQPAYQAPQPGYPPAQPGYPAQPGHPPAQPGYPPAPPAAHPGYAQQPGYPPAQPGYPPAPPAAQPGYPPQAPPQAPGQYPPYRG